MSIANNLEKVLFGVADKWCQGRFHDGDKHCVAGWIGLVLHDTPMGNPLYDYLDDFIQGYTDEKDKYGKGPEVTAWQDSHTQQEVIWMLEEAVDDARERGL